ncbi:MAG: 23S rRNA (adenine(2503)-C(2))-methyltransferase RlmN [Acidobacteria bacterium]|nr:MAG: 23S rRNA (adenine(2503)-C(2))-methyltransferase RlmN [Acidobacteriota bacterium]
MTGAREPGETGGAGVRPPLLGLLEPELFEAIRGVAPERYRAGQVLRWIHERRARSFEEMTDLPKALREALAASFEVGVADVASRTPAEDGAEKFLFALADGARVEAVYLPGRPAGRQGEGSRAAVCVSSQAGCALDCAFCVTGRLGSGRNLTAGEIVGQYLVIARERGLGPSEANVVFMGMGEPLLNVPNVLRALDLLEREVAPRRITVSTAGVVPGIEALAKRKRLPNLAVSLTAADDATRSRLMPVNRTWPIESLFASLARWPLPAGRRITFEVALVSGENDSDEDARKLARLVARVPSKVNLIPLNESPEWLPSLRRPAEERIDAFARVLVAAGVPVTVRRSKGLGAAAACGQLKGRQERR